MKKIINVASLRSFLDRAETNRTSDFEKYLIQEGVKNILLGGFVNESMVRFLEEIRVLTNDSNDSNETNEKSKISFGISKSISVEKSLKKGLLNIDFELGEEFGLNKEKTSETLSFICETDIFYKTDTINLLIVKKGCSLPWYSQIISWKEEDLYINNEAKIVIDLRPLGNVQTKDFDVQMLNDGMGNFGDKMNMIIIPTYEI